MDDKIFNLLEKILTEVQQNSKDIKKIQTILENDIKPNIKLALEGYIDTNEKLCTNDHKVNEENIHHKILALLSGNTPSNSYKVQLSDALWHKINQKISSQLSDNSYQIWIAPLKAIIDDNTVNIISPSKFHNEILKSSYSQIIENAVNQALSKKVEIVYS